VRRNLTVFLGLAALLVGVLVFSSRLSLSDRDSPQPLPQQVRLVEYLPDYPLAPTPPDHPLSDMQDLVDEIAEAAVQRQWEAATMAVDDLEETWEQGVFRQEEKLGIQREIGETIAELRRSVWARSEQSALQAAQRLTELISGV